MATAASLVLRRLNYIRYMMMMMMMMKTSFGRILTATLVGARYAVY